MRYFVHEKRKHWKKQELFGNTQQKSRNMRPGRAMRRIAQGVGPVPSRRSALVISGFEKSDDSMPSSTRCGTKSLDTPNQQTNNRVVLYSSLNKTIWPNKRKDKRMNTEGQAYVQYILFKKGFMQITWRLLAVQTFWPASPPPSLRAAIRSFNLDALKEESIFLDLKSES